MSDEDRGWVVEPAGAGDISLFVAVGEGVELSAQQQEALGRFLQALEGADAEVVGLGKMSDCPAKTTGCRLTCSTVICKELVCWKLNNAASAATSAGWTISGTFGLQQ